MTSVTLLNTLDIITEMKYILKYTGMASFFLSKFLTYQDVKVITLIYFVFQTNAENVALCNHTVVALC